VTLGRLAIHGHFYQPDRRDPFSGAIPAEPGAAPWHDWTSRVTAEAYRPNAERGSFGRMGWDVGPALATWIRASEPDVHARWVASDQGTNGIALPWHHAILPLASMRDRRTEIRWGIRDFELRFGRRPAGLWLPETAVDVPTLRIAAEEGIHYTILAPWQAGTNGDLDTRRPYRVDVGGGHAVVVMFADRELSAAVSFDPSATENADSFAHERVMPRLELPIPGGIEPIVLIATDGELYGHHQRFRDLFLSRLTGWYGPAARDPGFDVASLGTILAELHHAAFPVTTIREATSWSCHHGIARWAGECPCAPDGRWKRPLRLALDRLAATVDAVTDGIARELGVDAWAARDEYVDVAAAYVPAAAAVERALARAASDAPADARHRHDDTDGPARLRTVLAAQASRLSMFTSDAWYWDDPIRPETLQALRFAAHAARLVEPLAGFPIEAPLLEDLRAVRSPSSGLDGAALYRLALEQVGQPEPR